MIYFLILASSIFILPFIYLIFFTFPQADDWCFTSATLENGHLGSVYHWMQIWSGRYFTHFLNSFDPGTLTSAHLYPFIPLVLLFSLTTTFILWTKLILADGRLELARTIGLSLTALVTFLLLTPELSSTLYWASAGYTYTFGVSLFLSFILLFLRNQDSTRSWLGAILVLAVQGCNETFMIIMIKILVINLFLRIRNKQSLATASLWLVAALLGGAFVYFAPGTEIRAASFPLRKQFLFSVVHSISSLPEVYRQWLSHPLLWISAFVVSVFLPKPKHRRPSNKKWFIFAAGIAGTAIVLFASLWSMGQFPEPRSWIPPYLFFFLSFLNLFPGILPQHPALRLSSLLAFIAGVSASPQAANVVQDAFQNAPLLKKYNTEFIEKITLCKQQKLPVCSIPNYPNAVPSSLVYSTLTTDDSHWRNSCAASALGVNKIRIDSAFAPADPFKRINSVKVFIGLPLADLEKMKGFKLLKYWGLGKWASIENKTVTEAHLSELTNMLKEGVLVFQVEGNTVLAFYRKNQWTGFMSIVDASLISESASIINELKNPNHCSGFAPTDIPILIESHRLWLFNAGEQRIFEQPLSAEIQC